VGDGHRGCTTGDCVNALTLPEGRRLDPAKDYTVAVNGFVAAGGGEFGVSTEGKNRGTVGTKIGALVQHAQELPNPSSPGTPPRGRA